MVLRPLAFFALSLFSLSGCAAPEATPPSKTAVYGELDRNLTTVPVTRSSVNNQQETVVPSSVSADKTAPAATSPADVGDAAAPASSGAAEAPKPAVDESAKAAAPEAKVAPEAAKPAEAKPAETKASEEAAKKAAPAPKK